MDERHLRWATISGIAGIVSATVAVLTPLGVFKSEPATITEREIRHVLVEEVAPRPSDNAFSVAPKPHTAIDPEEDRRASYAGRKGRELPAEPGPSRDVAPEVTIPTPQRPPSSIQLKHVAQ